MFDTVHTDNTVVYSNWKFPLNITKAVNRIAFFVTVFHRSSTVVQMEQLLDTELRQYT